VPFDRNQRREQWSGAGKSPQQPDVPKSATLTRDTNGAVATVTVEGEDTWTLTRNLDGSVSGLSDTNYSVEVNRDGNGIVTGVTATQL